MASQEHENLDSKELPLSLDEQEIQNREPILCPRTVISDHFSQLVIFLS